MNTITRLTRSRVFPLLLTAATVLLIARAMQTLLPNCELLPSFLSPWLIAAAVLAMVYRVVNAYGWALVLRAMDQDVDGIHAVRVWLHAESRRWLPGGVWGYASRAVQARRLNVSAGVASASMLVELFTTVVAAIIVFFPVAVLYHREILKTFQSTAQLVPMIWLGIAAAATLAIFWILLQKRIVRKLDALRERFVVLQTVTVKPKKLMVVLVFFVAMGCLNGLVTACLLWSMPIGEFPPLAVIIAATSLSWVIGFFAVFAPGGLVVREACFAICVLPWMPYSGGLAVAVLARVVQLGAEILGMLLVGLTKPEAAMSRACVEPSVRL